MSYENPNLHEKPQPNHKKKKKQEIKDVRNYLKPHMSFWSTFYIYEFYARS